jgi:hypothetical protein
MTRRRKLLFALVAMTMSLTLTCAVVLAADLYAHHRAENSAGLNRWGYRGPVVGRKANGEIRIVMIGGSTVFGYGGPWNEAAPAFLEQELRRARPGTAISVVNLGYNNDGAFAALPTLEDYRYLDYDVVILYEGYNDRHDSAANTQVYRRQSVVFRLTGYSPILPLLLKEKAMALRSGGLTNAYAQEGKVVFRPNVAQRTSAAALETANAIGEALGRQLERLAEEPPGTPLPGSDCAPPWSRYCESIVRATRYARAQGAKVMVVAQPVYPSEHSRQLEGLQQASLAAALTKRFGADPGVMQLDLSQGIDLSDKNYSFDSMHLGRDGNLKLAQLMAPSVLALAWPEGK